jgi:hypothetical protein
MTCTSGCVCSFKYSWWWVQRAPETCREILQWNKIETANCCILLETQILAIRGFTWDFCFSQRCVCVAVLFGGKNQRFRETFRLSVQSRLKRESGRFIRNVGVVSVTIYGTVFLEGIIFFREIYPLTHFVHRVVDGEALHTDVDVPSYTSPLYSALIHVSSVQCASGVLSDHDYRRLTRSNKDLWCLCLTTQYSLPLAV